MHYLFGVLIFLTFPKLITRQPLIVVLKVSLPLTFPSQVSQFSSDDRNPIFFFPRVGDESFGDTQAGVCDPHGHNMHPPMLSPGESQAKWSSEGGGLMGGFQNSF